MTVVTTHKIRQTLRIESRATAVPGIRAYRCSLEDDHVETRVWEGLCDEDNPPSRTEFHPKPRQRWEVHTKQNVAALATMGWEPSILREPSKTPFADLDPALGDWMYQLVRLDLYSNMLFDVGGLPLVVAQDIEYNLWRTMDSPEGHYHYDKAIVHLSKHPHVQQLEEHREWPSSEDESCAVIEYFDFRWAPDVETYRRAWAKCQELDTAFPSTKFHRAVYDLDLLGLRAAGCCR